MGSTPTDASGSIDRSGWDVPQDFVNNELAFANALDWLVDNAMLAAAEAGWKSGRCVVLEPTTTPAKRSGLLPSQHVTITAQPKSRLDGFPVGGTVKATLAGETSVDPDGTKVPAAATFTYVAPGTRDKTGTVSLEARSKRGIGRAEVVLDTNARSYQATRGLDDFIGTGTICDLSQPFTISGTGVTVTFTPADDETVITRTPERSPISATRSSSAGLTPSLPTTPEERSSVPARVR